MDRELDHTDDLIDLGAASDETKGFAGPPIEEVGLYQPAGITED